jgi:HEPN domain-containing protein
MPNESIKSVVARQWVEKAEDDYKLAVYVLTMKQNVPFIGICFHAQQCVEKYIKAILIVHEIDFPKTHDLERLIHLLPKTILLPIAVSDQALLTTYAVTARYPGDDEPVSRADARHTMSVMRKVRKAARNFLSKNIGLIKPRKAVSRKKMELVRGCLKDKLSESVDVYLEKTRGKVDMPRKRT